MTNIFLKKKIARKIANDKETEKIYYEGVAGGQRKPDRQLFTAGLTDILDLSSFVIRP